MRWNDLGTGGKILFLMGFSYVVHALDLNCGARCGWTAGGKILEPEMGDALVAGVT